MVSKYRLVFDTTNTADSDSVGAYVRSSDGTLITHTTIGSVEALDVNVENTVTVTATDFDIRDLSSAQDSVEVLQDTHDDLNANANIQVGNVDVANGNPVPISDAGGSLTVDATDFDIRDLVHTQDSVRLGDGTSFLTSTTIASDIGLDVYLINADDIEVASNTEYAEDSIHQDADIGNYMLSVRQDTLASSTSASGDYQSFKTDALGRLWMNETHQTMAHSAVSVTSTATDLVASDLSNRKRIIVQNASNRDVYLGSASVTAANGIELSPGSSAELLIGPGIDLHGITSSGSADVRIMELA